jgi:hypothetical protein
MCSANNFRGRMTRDLIWTAFGRNAAKQIEVGLGVSRSQAWRIVSFGSVPRQLEGRFIEFIGETMARRRQEFAEAEEVIRNARYCRSLRALEAATGAPGDRSFAKAGRSFARPGKAPVK